MKGDFVPKDGIRQRIVIGGLFARPKGLKTMMNCDNLIVRLQRLPKRSAEASQPS